MRIGNSPPSSKPAPTTEQTEPQSRQPGGPGRGADGFDGRKVRLDPPPPHAADPLGAAQALLRQSGYTSTDALAAAYNDLVRAEAAGKAPAPQARLTLVKLVDRLRSNALGSTDGWDHATQNRLTAAAQALEAKILKTSDPSALALPVQLDPLTPAEAAQAARLDGLYEAQSKAAELWASVPADQLDVDLQPHKSAHDYLEAWKSALGKAVGPGDAKALKSDLDQNHDGLDLLANIYANYDQNLTLFNRGQGYESTAWKSQTYATVMQALQAQHPDAVFELGLVRQGKLSPEPRDPLRRDPGVIISMTEVGPDGKPTTTCFALDSNALDTQGVGRFGKALFANPDVASAWNAAMQSLAAQKKMPAGVVGGSAAATVENIAGSGLPAGLILDGLRQLDPDVQAKFFSTYGAQNKEAPDEVYGGLLFKVDTPATSDLIVAGDASAVAHGDPIPEPFSTSVNVSGTPNLDKGFNLVDRHPELVAPIFAQYSALRGDAPRVLDSQAALMNELGAAMNLAPNHLPKTAGDKALMAQGKWPFYEGGAAKVIAPAMNEIARQGYPVSVATLPVVFNSPQTGMVQLPLYRVTGRDGREFFVDNVGRRYGSFDDWKNNNKLPEGKMMYPPDGHITDKNGQPVFETHNTPAVVDSPGKWIIRAGDAAALAGGVVLAGAAIIGTDGLAVPVLAAGVSAWGIGRAAGSLYDLGSHDQSLGLDNPEARSAWVNLAANTMGLAALGESVRVASAVSDFATAGAVASTVGSRVLNTVPTVLYGADLASNWNQMSDQQRMVAVSQLVFWGAVQGHDVAGAGGVREYFAADDVKAQLEGAAATAKAAGLGEARPTGAEPVVLDGPLGGVGLRRFFALDRVNGASNTGDQWATFRKPTGDLFAPGGPKGSDPLQAGEDARGIGDCYLISSMSAVANSHPEIIEKMIKGDAQNGWDVIGHASMGDGVNGYRWQEQRIHVDNLPLRADGTPNFARSKNGGLWPAILERAYLAKISRLSGAAKGAVDDPADNYLNLWGDRTGANFANKALEWMTGCQVRELNTPLRGKACWDATLTALKAGDPVVLGTYPFASREGIIVPRHAYSVVGTEVDASGETRIVIRNPWNDTTEAVDYNTFKRKFLTVFIADMNKPLK